MNRAQWLAAIKAKRVRIEPNNEATCDGKAATIDPADAVTVAKALGGTLPSVKVAAASGVCCCALDADGEPVAVFLNGSRTVTGPSRKVKENHGYNLFRGEHVRLVLVAAPAPKPVAKKATQPPKATKSTPEKPADKKAPRASDDAGVAPKERKRERAPGEKAKDSGKK